MDKEESIQKTFLNPDNRDSAVSSLIGKPEIDLSDSMGFNNETIHPDRVILNPQSPRLTVRRKPTSTTKAEFIHSLFNNMGFTMRHVYLLMSIFLIRTVEGTEVFSLSLASKMIEKTFNLEENSSSLINLVILIGNFIGCFISILVDHRLPRKHLTYSGVICIIVFGFISVFSTNIISTLR